MKYIFNQKHYVKYSVFIFLAGLANTQFTTNLNSIIISNTENKFLGLVTSLWMMAIMGTAAIGGPIVGYFSEHFSVQVFTLVAVIVYTLLVFFWYNKKDA